MVIQSNFQEDDDQADQADLPEILDHHYENMNWEFPPSRCDSIVLFTIWLLHSAKNTKYNIF